MTALLIGCGNSRVKKLHLNQPEWIGELTTLDMNPDCGADHVIDMGAYAGRLPFADESFDELAAYDTLEHWGRQGDWRGWFDEMADYHRILKPGGVFGIIVPVGPDAIADPGHCRFFSANHFAMLNQAWYEKSLAKGQQITDYRWYFKKDFEVIHFEQHGDHHLSVMLRKA